MASGTSKKFNVAICGSGRAGQIHIGNCQQNPSVNIKYLVELDVKKATEVLSDLGIDGVTVVHYDQFQTVLDDPSIAGIIVATVTLTHEEIVKRCIENKKPVFCEKPISQDINNTKSCYEEAKKNNVPLFCAFNRRFDATHRNTKAACLNGDVGKIHMVKICSRNSIAPPIDYLRISGGIFHDRAVHDIDMALWMLDECPISVFSYAHAFHEDIKAMGDVDNVSITMKFQSGAIVQIDLSRFASYGYDQRVEVFGELGMVESTNQSPTSVVRSLGTGVSKDVIQFSFPQRYRDAYAAEISHFVNIMKGDEQPLITMSNVLLVTLIASACEASNNAGKPMKINKEDLSFE